MMQPMIPPPDLAPLPAPAWLFQVLLLVTFFIHLIFMNLMLGSSVLAAAGHLRARSSKNGASWERLSAMLMRQLPWLIAFTVTTGIAPLLFVQVLYGPLFYSATITVGWLWMFLVLVIVVAYYAAYAYKLGPARRRLGSGPARWAYVAALLFVAAAIIQVVVNVLQITPQRWLSVYQGMASAFVDGSLLPRFLHFALSTVAFTGLYIAVRAVRGSLPSPDDASSEVGGAGFTGWAAGIGVRMALWPTAVQVGIGTWLLLTLPADARSGLMGGNTFGTAVFAISFLLAIGLLVMLVRITRPSEQRGLVIGSAGAMLVTMFAMVVLRDSARRLAVAGEYSIWDLPVRSQTGTLILFLVLLVSGLVLLAAVLRRVLAELKETDGGTRAAGQS
jgi:hypothetical protein